MAVKCFFFLFLISLLISCGTTEFNCPLWLSIRLPASLEDEGKRHRYFMSRVAYLEVVIRTESGDMKKQSFPPGSWRKLRMTGFPDHFKKRISIKAKVWDRKKDGGLRSFPALVGSQTGEGGACDEAGGKVISLSLSWRVSVREYD